MRDAAKAKTPVLRTPDPRRALGWCQLGLCAALAWAGVALDEVLNQADMNGPRRISKPESRVGVWVIPTNEEAVIAHDTWALTQNNRS